MKNGTPFEVTKEVYDRAKAQSKNKDSKFFYMTAEDQEELFDVSIRCGYGLYSCMVYEENGKYICSYKIGNSCD